MSPTQLRGYTLKSQELIRHLIGSASYRSLDLLSKGALRKMSGDKVSCLVQAYLLFCYLRSPLPQYTQSDHKAFITERLSFLGLLAWFIILSIVYDERPST